LQLLLQLGDATDECEGLRQKIDLLESHMATLEAQLEKHQQTMAKVALSFGLQMA
jgi:hypothetical protein